jgi:ubiquinone/menaquinone biosynthesis C-methylase UbiE
VHPELERLRHEFGWQPDVATTYDPDTNVWRSPAIEVDDSVYADEQWRELDALLEHGWWTMVRNRIVEDALVNHQVTTTLWDVGGGTGIVSSYLHSHGFPVIGVEPSHVGAMLTARRHVTSFCARLDELQLPDESLQGVSMFDVLEHLPDRDAMLREIYRLTAPGAHFILTLPALRILWSQFDLDQGHFIRYSKRAILRDLQRHGFQVVQSGYFFALTVLPLFLLRALPYRLGYRNAIATAATQAADGGILGRVAGWIERRLAMRVPFGSSLLVVARKPEA